MLSDISSAPINFSFVIDNRSESVNRFLMILFICCISGCCYPKYVASLPTLPTIHGLKVSWEEVLGSGPHSSTHLILWSAEIDTKWKTYYTDICEPLSYNIWYFLPIQALCFLHLQSVMLSLSEEIAFWFAPSFLWQLLHLKSERSPQHIAQVVESHLSDFI